MEPTTEIVRAQPWKKFCDPSKSALKKPIQDAAPLRDYDGANGSG